MIEVSFSELYLGRAVPELDGPPGSSLEFYRRWVAPNRPAVFRGAAGHWPAAARWQSNQYFR